MRYLILSDIHGAPAPLEQVLRFYHAGHYDQLILLGDLLYYGPRNSVPCGMDADRVARMLNEHAREIVAVRGNCDAEVDQMLLRFDVMSDYILLVDNGRRYFLTHGHRYNATRMPQGGYDAILHGHTHLQGFTHADDGTLIVNPGSITFPKGGNPPTFATLCDGCFRIHLLDGSVLDEHQL